MPHTPPPDADPLVGRVLEGGFRILGRLGSGGLSSVYRAVRDDGLPAAVKVMHPLYLDAPPLRRRFLREGELAAELHGEGVVAGLGGGEIDGRPFLAFELVEGQLLTSVIARAPLAVEEAARIAQAVLRALGRVHRLGVVHGDVKPTNVMRLSDGSVKLLDFGMASSAPPPSQAALEDRTPQSGPIGTPAYSAPERGDALRVDGRCDLYSVGVMLFEMLTGRRPFRGDPLEMLRSHAEDPAPRTRTITPSLSSAIDAVVARALEKDPAARFADARAMDDAIEAALAHH